MDKIGWIGTGKMGTPMAQRLLDRGYELYINDTSVEHTKNLTEKGAIYVDTPARLARAADVIFSMLPTAESVLEVAQGKNGLCDAKIEGTIFVDMSTIDPGTSAAVDSIVARKGARFLRATVTGSTEYAKEGTLGIMVSGGLETYRRVLPLLKILGNRQTYLGEREEARYMKIIINMMVGTTMQMLAESLVLGEKAGLEWETMIDLIAGSAAAAPIIRFKTDNLKKRDFRAMSTIKTCVKDMNFALELSKDEGAALPLTALATQFYRIMEARGGGALDYSALILLNEELNGIIPNDWKGKQQ